MSGMDSQIEDETTTHICDIAFVSQRHQLDVFGMRGIKFVFLVKPNQLLLWFCRFR